MNPGIQIYSLIASSLCCIAALPFWVVNPRLHGDEKTVARFRWSGSLALAALACAGVALWGPIGGAAALGGFVSAVVLLLRLSSLLQAAVLPFAFAGMLLLVAAGGVIYALFTLYRRSGDPASSRGVLLLWLAMLEATGASLAAVAYGWT
jgi:hypothetical protein